MSKKATIQEVAKQAQVSMMTVSRVLNNAPSVKPATRQKIEEAIQTLGYKPNFSARKLSGGRNYFVGVLCYQPNSAYVSQFLFGCMRRCSEIGYHLIVEESAGEEDTKQLIDSIHDDVDGIILLPPVSENPVILKELESRNIPFVQIGPITGDLSPNCVASVAIDDFQAAFELTEFLIQSGHTDIGFITGDLKQQVSTQRLEGYQAALQKHNIAVNNNFIAEGDFNYKSALIAAEKLIKLSHRPSAIFASNDDMAAAVIAIAHKHHLNVPENMSIVGFDDTSTATMVWPQLTTVRQPLKNMAYEAINRLLQNSESTNNPLPFEIVYRESVSSLR